MKRAILATIFFLFGFSPAFSQGVTNCRATTAAPTYVNLTIAPCSLDLSGNIRTVTSLAANSSVNVNQIAGTGTAVNSGLLSAGVQRVTLATDQVQLTNALKVDGSAVTQPVSGPLTDAQLRATPVPISGALTANQSVNVAQINGVTPLMGAGNTGTGSPRVTQSTDQAALAAWGHGATAAAAPAGATQAGVRSGANIVGLIQADTSAAITMSTATTTEFVALSGSTKIYITSFDFIAAGTTNVTLKYGTGTNCGTGTTSLTGVYTLTAQAGVAKGNGLGPVLVVPAGNAFCVTNSQAIVIGGSISYTQF